MKTLPVRPQPMSDEPLKDYIERLAEANDWDAKGVVRYIKQAGPDHAATLAALAGCNQLPEFSAPGIPNVDIAVEKRGLPPTAWTYPGLRFCPACIGEFAWVRPLWRLKQFTACPRHRLRLLHACVRCDQCISWRSAIAGRCSCGLRHLEAAETAEPDEVALMTAVAAGWQGLGEMVLGDLRVQLSAAQWIKLTCWLGSLGPTPLFEQNIDAKKLVHRDEDGRRARWVASILGRWPSAFVQYLESLAAAAPADATLQQLFSPAYRVIHHHLAGSEFSFLRGVFRQVVAQHWRGQLCQRNSLMAPDLIAEHRYQPLAKVARQNRVSRVGLKRMVECKAVPGHKTTARHGIGREVITVDPADVSALVAARSEYRCLKSAALLLGLKRSRLRQLVGLGIVAAEAHPEWDRSSHWFFSDKDLRSFVDRLRGKCCSEAPDSSVPFRSVLRYQQLSPEELRAMFEALLSGSLPLQMPPGMNISAMQLDRERTFQWLQEHRDKTRPWLTPTQVAAALQLKEEVVYELIERRLLKAEQVPGGRGVLSRVTRDDLDAFRLNYVSLAALARSNRMTPAAMLKRFKLEPVTGPTVDGGRQYFLCRSDVAVAGLIA